MEDVTKSPRTYRSPLREEAARRTRATVVRAAAEVFVAEGYAGATIDQIAARADVSRPTVFAVGNKAQLFALARQEAATTGDHPTNEDRYRDILTITDPHRLLGEFAAFTAAVAQRLGPLQLVLEQAAGTDPDLADQLRASQQDLIDRARGIITALAATGTLRPGTTADTCTDTLWLQIQPTTYQRLTAERGWTHDAFERWHATTMINTLLQPQPQRSTPQT
jgi:AcrR family transcriptional regulator